MVAAEKSPYRSLTLGGGLSVIAFTPTIRPPTMERFMGKRVAVLIWLSCSSLAIGQVNGHLFLDEASSSVPTYVDPRCVLGLLRRYQLHPRAAQLPAGDDNCHRRSDRHWDGDVQHSKRIGHKAMLAPAIASYVKVNTVKRRLLPRFTLDKPYEMVQQSPHRGDLSSVGFDRDKTVAVVSVFAGNGQNCVLVKKNGKWEFLTNWSDEACAWAS